MNMKLCVNNDWLRRQIETDADTNVEAGRAIRRSVDIVKAAEAARQVLAQSAPLGEVTPKTEAALSRLVQLTVKQRLHYEQTVGRTRCQTCQGHGFTRDGWGREFGCRDCEGKGSTADWPFKYSPGERP